MTLRFVSFSGRGNRIAAIGLSVCVVLTGAIVSPAQDEDLPVIQSRRPDGSEEPGPDDDMSMARMRIGLAFAMSTSLNRSTRTAELVAETGATAAKVFPDLIAWGEMQRRKESKIDFAVLDGFVSGYQSAGFDELVIPLKAHSPWASTRHDRREGFLDPTPKPDAMDAYAAWISAVVERYDGDGEADMPGLRTPVRIYEIGAAYSADEPEPPEAYVGMLRRAYEAAHTAFDEVLIAHAGFLATTAFDGDPAPGDYEAAFDAAGALLYHRLPAIRTVLDAFDAFDLVNVHAMGSPYEIEDIVAWLRFEMERRDFDKPIMIGESGATPFILGGPATDCGLEQHEMGVIVPPATEQDRCQIAEYFKLLIGGNSDAEQWAQRWAAADVIKKIVVAADQGVMLVNAGYIEDLDWLKKKKAQGAAGIAPWGGMLSMQRKDRRPALLALNQLTRVLRGYDDITRIPAVHDNVRIYRIRSGDQTSWIAWADAETLVLPGDKLPRMEIDLPVESSNVMAEFMISHSNQIHATRKMLTAGQGTVTVDLTPFPVFIGTKF